MQRIFRLELVPASDVYEPERQLRKWHGAQEPEIGLLKKNLRHFALVIHDLLNLLDIEGRIAAVLIKKVCR